MQDQEQAGSTALLDAPVSAISQKVKRQVETHTVLFLSFPALLKLIASDAVSHHELSTGLFAFGTPLSRITEGHEKWNLIGFHMSEQRQKDVYEQAQAYLNAAMLDGRLLTFRDEPSDQTIGWYCHQQLNQLLINNGFDPLPEGRMGKVGETIQSNKVWDGKRWRTEVTAGYVGNSDYYDGSYCPDIDDRLLYMHAQGRNTTLIALWNDRKGQWGIERWQPIS